jgi:hypothetical protein
MLVFNRLPRLNHPSFNIPGILRATSDRYFVVVSHPRTARAIEDAEQAFKALNVAPVAVHRVPR